MHRIALLGAAKIAPLAMIEPVARRSDVTVSVVACRDLERGAAFARQHGIPVVDGDYAAVCERDDVDIVYNALPPHRHCDLTIAALRAGKHVLCEKPFAMNAIEAAAMVNAATSSGSVLIEAFHYRFHPAFIHLLELLDTAGLGAVQTLDAHFNAPIGEQPGELRFDPLLGGGALMDLGTYPLHWLRTITGGEPEVLSAEVLRAAGGVDMAMAAKLQFAGNIAASISCSMAAGQERQAQLSVVCEHGTLVMNNPLCSQWGHSIDLSWHDGRPPETTSVPGMTTYDHQLDHLIALVNGTGTQLTGGADAVAQMQAIDAIYQSAGMPRG